jgi:CheY-like chemotaxis protein
LGKGSEFIVALPLPLEPASTVATARSEADAPSVQRDQPKRRVLIIDDNPDAAEALGLFLAALGHKIVTANDGPEALALVNEFVPDAAIVDVGLPQMDGYQVARRLRQLLPTCVIMALTGWRLDPASEAVRRAGFDACFTKPIDTVQLIQILSDLRPPSS